MVKKNKKAATNKNQVRKKILRLQIEHKKISRKLKKNNTELEAVENRIDEMKFTVVADALNAADDIGVQLENAEGEKRARQADIRLLEKKKNEIESEYYRLNYELQESLAPGRDIKEIFQDVVEKKKINLLIDNLLKEGKEEILDEWELIELRLEVSRQLVLAEVDLSAPFFSEEIIMEAVDKVLEKKKKKPAIKIVSEEEKTPTIIEYCKERLKEDNIIQKLKSGSAEIIITKLAAEFCADYNTKHKADRRVSAFAKEIGNIKREQ